MARRRHRRARRRAAKRRGSTRITRSILIGLGLVLPVLYVVFTKTMFDPFEAPAPAFRLLVPRDVDLYLHRDKLASDLDTSDPALPEPLVLRRWMRTLAWRDFAGSDWGRQHGLPLDVGELLSPLARALEGGTGPLDPVADLLGEEVAVIGRDPWTAGYLGLLARLSTKGKLAVEALDFEGVREGVLAGAQRSEVVDEQIPELRYHRLDLADGSSWFYFRESDLLCVANQSELVRDVKRTLLQGPELSLGLSRLYLDNLSEPALAPEQRFSADFSLDVQNLVNGLDLLPDTDRRREDAVANILPELLDLDRLRDAVGRLAFDKLHFDLELFADVAGDAPLTSKGGVQGTDSFLVHEQLGDALSLLPRGTSAVLTMNVDLDKLLAAVVAGLDPELVTLINSTIRDVARWNPTFSVNNVTQLIAELDQALEGRISVGLRPLDHEIPEGAQPVPALVFLAPIRDLDTWNAIGQALVNGNKVLGVDSEHMWQQPHAGLGVHKFLPLPITSAEGLSFMPLDGKTLVFSTDSDFTEEIVEVYSGRGQALAAEPGVSDLLATYEAHQTRANLAGWVDAKGLSQMLEPYADWRAELDTQLDFAVLRAQERRKILRAEHPGLGDGKLPPEQEAELADRLDEIILGMDEERLANDVPRVAREFRESFAWLKLLRQLSASLRLGEHTVGGAVHLEMAVE